MGADGVYLNSGFLRFYRDRLPHCRGGRSPVTHNLLKTNEVSDHILDHVDIAEGVIVNDLYLGFSIRYRYPGRPSMSTIGC